MEDLNTILGDDLTAVSKSKVLMVGAGGIGCELLKNLVQSGFKNIEIVDLDTIDLSNLNRQFLFQKQHIKKSKAHVAKESALKFNPNVHIKSHHASIFDPQFSFDWIQGFDICLNALDNVPARKHVNMMCLAAGIPLVESGTAGYLGQVTVHAKDHSECFDCEPKPTPKTYPVCTIRSTPSLPIHCIVWAKSFLFSQLFGKDEDEGEVMNSDDADENELAKLQEETQELSDLRSSMGTPDFPKKVFEKVFKVDVERLLSMKDLWKTRDAPSPLDFDILSKNEKKEKVEYAALERDQNVWTLPYALNVFNSSLMSLSNRLIEARKSDSEATLEFDKDDEDALDFVTASSNFRSKIFGIEMNSEFKVKEMAGNIIPAIATTNAVIAGIIVLQAIMILNGRIDECKNSYLVYSSRGKNNLIQNENKSKRNKHCLVCGSTYLKVELDCDKATISQIVQKVVVEKLNLDGDVSVEESGRLLYDVDFDDNGDMTLSSLKINDGSRIMFSVDDSNNVHDGYNIILFIKHQAGKEDIEIGGGEPKLYPREKVVEPVQTEVESRKRKAEEELENGKSKKIVCIVDGNNSSVIDLD